MAEVFEKDLPVKQELQTGDLIRVVDSLGVSKLLPSESIPSPSGIKGVAYLTTDPGTSTANDVWLAMETGTYTNFGGVAANAQDYLVFDGTDWGVSPRAGSDYHVFVGNNPLELPNPATREHFIGIYQNRLWVKDSNGSIAYQVNQSDFDFQDQARGVELGFFNSILDDGGVFNPNPGSSTVAKLMRLGLWKKTKLLLTPAGTKAGTGVGDGKLYSIKGSDFTVARNSKASYVDVDGYIRQAQADEARIDYADGKASIKTEFQSTNKVLYPFSLEDMYWIKSGLSVDSSGFDSPFKDTPGNVLTIARKIIEDTSTGAHRVYHYFDGLTDGGTYSISMIVKSNGKKYASIYTYDGVADSDVRFDLELGGVVSGSGVISPFVDGYYLLSTTVTLSAGQTGFTLYLRLLSDTQVGNYTGDGVSGVYVSGIQLEKSPVATSFINDPEAVEGGEVSRLEDLTVPPTVASSTKGALIYDNFVQNLPTQTGTYYPLAFYTGKMAVLNSILTSNDISRLGLTEATFVTPITRVYSISITVSGNGICYWGDGTSDVYNGTDIVLSHTYTSYPSVVAFVGTLTKFRILESGSNANHDIATLPRELTYYFNYGQNTTSGDVATLPTELLYYYNGGQNTTSGDIAALPSGLVHYVNGGQNTTSGDIAALPSGLVRYVNGGQNTTSGDIANLPSGITYYYNVGQNRVNQYTAGRVWAGIMERIYHHPDAGYGLTSIMIDNLLIDLDNSTTSWAGDKLIDIAGNNAARTSASDTAVASLQSKGVTVITN